VSLLSLYLSYIENL